MGRFHTLFLGRLLVFIFLLIGLNFQGRLVFACELMDGAPQSVCCCGDRMMDGCALGGGCDIHSATRPVACCEISLEEPAAYSAAPAAQNHAVALLEAPQPPPLLPPLFIYGDPGEGSLSSSIPLAMPFWLAGADTYLLTLRLRN